MAMGNPVGLFDPPRLAAWMNTRWDDLEPADRLCIATIEAKAAGTDAVRGVRFVTSRPSLGSE